MTTVEEFELTALKGSRERTSAGEGDSIVELPDDAEEFVLVERTTDAELLQQLQSHITQQKELISSLRAEIKQKDSVIDLLKHNIRREQRGREKAMRNRVDGESGGAK